MAVTTAALAATMLNYNLCELVDGRVPLLIISLSIGAISSYLVTKTGIHSFPPLAMFLMLQGINLAVTKLVTGWSPPDDLRHGGYNSASVLRLQLRVFGVDVQITVVWWLLFVALASWLLFKTRFGNWIFAVGGNPEASRAVGVPVDRVKIILFMVVAASCWFVGQHNLYEFDSIQAGQGVGNEFLYIIAAVVGGCAMTGGKGTAIGTALGALIYGMTNQGIVYAGWNPDWSAFPGDAAGRVTIIPSLGCREVPSDRVTSGRTRDSDVDRDGRGGDDVVNKDAVDKDAAGSEDGATPPIIEMRPGEGYGERLRSRD